MATVPTFRTQWNGASVGQSVPLLRTPACREESQRSGTSGPVFSKEAIHRVPPSRCLSFYSVPLFPQATLQRGHTDPQRTPGQEQRCPRLRRAGGAALPAALGRGQCPLPPRPPHAPTGLASSACGLALQVSRPSLLPLSLGHPQMGPEAAGAPVP